MKNVRFAFTFTMVVVITCLLFFATVSATAFAQASSGKVLLVPREGYSQDLDLMISREVDVMTGLLKSAGFTVDIATTSGSPIIGPSQKIENVLKLAQVNVNEYAGVLMPCMAVGLFPGPPVALEAVAVVKRTLAAGRPVASALGSTIVLAEAGVLRERSMRSSPTP